jgi:hypothetical protein
MFAKYRIIKYIFILYSIVYILMGMFSSKLAGDKVESIKISTGQNKTITSDDTNFLKKYLDYLNQFGYLKIGVKLDVLKKKVIEEFIKAGLKNVNETQLPNELMQISKMFITANNYQQARDGMAFSLIPLGIMSLSGLICVVEPDTDFKSAVPTDFKIEILIPYVLFSEVNREFIDLVVTNFNVDSYKGTINAANNKYFFDKIHNVFRNIASDRTKLNIKIINLIEFLLKIGMISMLVSIIQKESPQNPVQQKDKLVDYINGLVIDSFKIIKEDECIEKNSVFTYDQNICNVKKAVQIEEKTVFVKSDCPPVVSCPKIAQEKNILEIYYPQMLIGSSVLIILLFIIIAFK